MPVKIKKNSRGGWDIVEKETGKVVGHSETQTNAQRSANVRNAVHYTDWRPTGKKARK